MISGRTKKRFSTSWSMSRRIWGGPLGQSEAMFLPYETSMYKGGGEIPSSRGHEFGEPSADWKSMWSSSEEVASHSADAPLDPGAFGF